MGSPKLKPCPHCGSTDLRVYWNDIYGKNYVRCHTCHMQGPEVYGREKASEAWNELPRALTWTKETPTVSGVYWLKNPNSDAEEIVLLDGLSVYYMMTEWFESLSELPDGCEWAGPLTLPKEVG